MTTPMPQPAQPSDLRCADSDRELVADVLNAAYAEGRITQQEHSERLDAVWQARTFGQLTPITADLMPVGGARHPAVPATTGRSGVVVDPHNQNPEADSAFTIMGTVRREGHWRLRRRTTGLVVMGDLRMDLTDAVWEAHECVVQVPVIMGDITVTVPEGVQVRDETTTIMGDTKIRGLGPAAADAPTLVLRGLVLMGEVKVNGPGYESLGKRLGLTR
ncbi:MULTISPECIES: DUF1707 SHOCT-like domain-containing protein [unclassified Luteococcus]|uniref:DUF1707 SHOCT-like domain-containing protein n=1 Tax=unclassified Luteococcus TaxID=2639923 RepID=UPI00313C26B3